MERECHLIVSNPKYQELLEHYDNLGLPMPRKEKKDNPEYLLKQFMLDLYVIDAFHEDMENQAWTTCLIGGDWMTIDIPYKVLKNYRTPSNNVEEESEESGLESGSGNEEKLP
jgi:hypothetical protein